MGTIVIGNNRITFSREIIISHIQILKDVICFSTSLLESDLDDSNLETHQIWKERCAANPSQLFCYNFIGKLKWQLPYDNVVGFGKIDLDKLTESDFITPEHYKKYIKKYKGKELLEVYAGNFRFVVDANTGEIYDKMESR